MVDSSKVPNPNPNPVAKATAMICSDTILAHNKQNNKILFKTQNPMNTKYKVDKYIHNVLGKYYWDI